MGAKPLMIQGTMSGVGKSLLVAGLCRILAQDGVRVAPFKSQNMALNSAVTGEGLEIGRAQAMQAEAAGVPAAVAMNPILLKPTTDVGSQVIVRGKPVATMAARDYFSYKRSLVGPIREAYDELSQQFDVILIEGAGSPVELNLMSDDIVNMGMARLVSSPVLLVGDIDRGGVFAQLIGTMELLEPDERRMVRGSVVNKFRGDASLFDEGLAILEERMGVPVAGLVPYLQLELDDEDSLSDRLGMTRHHEPVDVAVIRLPKISNFTDFIALEAVEGVGVRYVRRPQDLGSPDLVILPGTKATIADLLWLRTSGLEAAIMRLSQGGTPVMGICGGYQMLGQSIADPLGMEGGGTVAGMGLLPVRTSFGPEKHVAQAMGSFCRVGGTLAPLAGVQVRGYEIHMGGTERLGGEPLVRLAGRDGAMREDGCQAGNVYGCYLHGIFDEPLANRALVQALMGAKGLDATRARAVDMAAYRQHQYDLLADGLRASLDMGLVRAIIEEGL